jgi:hypothetical protein
MLSRWQRKQAVTTASAESPKKGIVIISSVLFYMLSSVGVVVRDDSEREVEFASCQNAKIASFSDHAWHAG